MASCTARSYGTFDEFIAATLGGARAGYGYRLIRAADTFDELLAEGLPEEGETPATRVTPARELRRSPREKRAQVSRRAGGAFPESRQGSPGPEHHPPGRSRDCAPTNASRLRLLWSRCP